MQTVTLTIGWENKATRSYVDVPAKVFGVWAVHRPYIRMEEGKPLLDDTQWSITHAPTGLNTFANSRLRSVSWAAAKELAETLPAYQAQEEVTADAARDILAILRKHGLQRYP